MSTAELFCNHFTAYVCEHKANIRHVRRVLPWLGLLADAIDRRKDEWRLNKNRQLMYREGGQWFKVRYCHKLPRGGIEIVQKETADARADGQVVHQFNSFDDVKRLWIA